MIVLGPPFRGSSPRVRGTVRKGRRQRCRWRIIPACAGNGVSPESLHAACSDHPRVCGERMSCRHFHGWHPGSSPRVRGTGRGGCHGIQDRRIIPACAGNGVLQLISLRLRADHPRVCGERTSGNPWIQLWVGSSPRVRGTGVSWENAAREARIIPACAGNGRRVQRVMPHRPDHPRVCGERHPVLQGDGQHLGSSPRVRGTDERKVVERGRGRIIPACAGNGGEYH